MMESKRVLEVARALAYGLTSIIAIPLLVLGSRVAQFVFTIYEMPFGFEIMAMMTAILSIFTLPVMLWMSYKRQGAFPNMVIVELFWTHSLWILWLCTGATAASNSWAGGCNSGMEDIRSADFAIEVIRPACNQTLVLVSMAILGFTFMFCANLILWVLVIRSHRRGNCNVWNQSVLNIDYNAPAQRLINLTGDLKKENQFTEKPKVDSTLTLVTPSFAQPQRAYTPSLNYASSLPYIPRHPEVQV
ncbi:hypothetical protein CPB83DRAFT_881915 [Crepidotus variabilis]|uniref:MARVEL domain-containing protein n=1 Tax=Crepidotus variabilis TaxID=179855 RepID=A0A9P6JRP0_9AGAR|nr:hypothetical protein CPB83DRAFT_881915 [Crepidotus variabilis]